MVIGILANLEKGVVCIKFELTNSHITSDLYLMDCLP